MRSHKAKSDEQVKELQKFSWKYRRRIKRNIKNFTKVTLEDRREEKGGSVERVRAVAFPHIDLKWGHNEKSAILFS